MVNVITVEANGNSYDNLLSYSIRKDIEELCGTFTITATSTDEYAKNPIKEQDPIVIAIDGEPVITGIVDDIDVEFSANSHKITISGRDKTADFVDSTLDAKTFNPPIAFETLLKQLLGFVGYTVVPANKKIGLGLTVEQNQISIINNYGTIAPFTTAEGIQLRHSESAFNLIKRCAERRQIILNTDGNGNIVIAKIGDKESRTILQNIKALGLPTQGNNLKNGRVTRSFADRFYKYVVKSMTTEGTNAGGVQFSQDSQNDPLANNATPQSGIAFDFDVRPSRILTLIGSTAMTSSDCKKRADWEANIRKVKGYSYQCEVYGMRQNLDTTLADNPLWFPNTLVYITDDFAGIDTEMLLKTVEYTKDLDSGTVTRLTFVDQQAYSTSISEPLLRKKVDNEVTSTLFPI